MLFSIFLTFSIISAFIVSRSPFKIPFEVSSEWLAERRKWKQLETARIEARRHIATLQKNAIRLRKEPLVSRVLNLWVYRLKIPLNDPLRPSIAARVLKLINVAIANHFNVGCLN